MQEFSISKIKSHLIVLEYKL